MTRSERGQVRGSLRPWERELGLNKDLLYRIFLGIKLMIDLINVLKTEPMGEHLSWVQLPLLNLGQQRLPVLLHGCLGISDQADTALHHSTNIEVVGLGKELAPITKGSKTVLDSRIQHIHL